MAVSAPSAVARDGHIGRFAGRVLNMPEKMTRVVFQRKNYLQKIYSLDKLYTSEMIENKELWRILRLT
jgi:hypothetical protein